MLNGLLSLHRESDEDYHSQSRNGAYMSSHLLAEFRRCPYQYWRIIHGLAEPRKSSAFTVGRAVHTMLLEGIEEFQRRFATDAPINQKTGQPYGGNTNKYRDWKAVMEEQGRAVLTPSEARLVHCVTESAGRHPAVQTILSSGMAEGVLRSTLEHVPAQIKIDWYTENTICEGPALIDLKTTDDLDYFKHDARRYGYMHQFAFYRSVVATVCGDVFPVYVIAVEKKEPYRCGIWAVPTTNLELASAQNSEALRQYRECAASDHWPTGYETLHVLEDVA